MTTVAPAGLYPQTAAVAADIRRAYGWRIAALVLLMSAVALLDGLAMALLLPLLGSIGFATGSTGAVAGGVMAVLAPTGASLRPAAIVTVLLVLLAVQFVLSVAQQWWVSSLQRDYGARWQTRLFDAFIHADWQFFTEQKLGNLTNLIAQETFRLSGAFLILTQIASMAVATVVYIVVALSIAWPVTVMMVALGVVLTLAVRGIGRRSYDVGLRLGPLGAELNVLLTEFLGGAKLIKATATEDAAVSRIARVVGEMRVQHTWATFLPALSRAVLEFVAMAALCLLLVFGTMRLAIPAATIIVVLALFARLLPRFNAVQQSVHILGTYVPAYGEASGLLQAAEAASERVRDGDRPAATAAPVGALRIAIGRGGYGTVTRIRDIAIDLPERGLVGIAGESGAGKSTLVNCVLGLAAIQAGDVRLGGVSIFDVPPPVWRRQIGYVPQDTVLFHLSIRDNIAWGAPEAREEEIVAAARQALAHEFILAQPHGYDTVIGDQGVRLSGGQRQRLCIARALLMRPRLLLMDEATNALDLASEAAVMETVEQLRTHMCIVMVAHRLSALRSADMVVMLDQGTVAETGTWDALLARRGQFARLASTA